MFRNPAWLRKLMCAVLALLLICGGFFGPGAVSLPAPALGETTGKMSLLAINVGKADALLLRCGGTAYLIDTGTKDSAGQMLAVLAKNSVTRLTGVVLTHTDSDHVGGLKALLASGIEVERIYASAYYNKKKHPAEKALKKTDSQVIFLAGGDSLPLEGGSLTVLGPLRHNTVKENNNSLVLLAEGGGGTLLLTGDMEFPEEAELLAAGLVPRADVLKVGNHGNGDATSEQLVEAVSPQLAVISTNTAEKSDSPSPRVLQLFSRRGIPVYQTQETVDGVLVTFREGEITVEMQ